MGQIRIKDLTLEEKLQMETQRRALRNLSRDELLAFADQLLWAQWHRERVVKGLSDRCLELELELSCVDGGDAEVSAEHRQWARDLLA